MLSAKPDHSIDCLFLDLDGTILDVRKRLYACYVDSMGQDAVKSPVSPAVYFRLRRGRTPMDRVLALSGYRKTEQDFWDEWFKRIEAPDYLVLDTVKPGFRESIAEAASYVGRTILVTMRKNRAGLIEQLENLGLTACFDEVITVSGTKDAALQGVKFKKAVFIGDTEEDMMAARRLGAHAVGVTSGARRKAFLPADIHVANLKEIEWEKMAIRL